VLEKGKEAGKSLAAGKLGLTRDVRKALSKIAHPDS